jgi:hypothetical protein
VDTSSTFYVAATYFVLDISIVLLLFAMIFKFLPDARLSCSANFSAIPRAMPRELPVISAHFPLNDMRDPRFD